ncbi:putative sensory transducer protein YvaQ [Paraliobacillus quinghaiensis]|uniref:Sensory transducer protein YvaQ n=1 Tax=Paraliobacillus quinghaiensis TaxID=470815 RepID=A0A917WXV2_9BACI|nr:methyl-accepting chemotaxis protein [Paraliobacillus quinghaiensis]GGM38024.1 putative sensory transducer protein YvaQ [Paraliobacillus quinghaiensis]
MRKLNFKSLRVKILFGFGIVIVLATILSLYNGYSVNESNSNIKKMIDRDVSLLITEEQLAINMAERSSLLRGYLLFGKTSYKDAFTAGIEESIALENRAKELSNSEQLEALLEKKFEWGTYTDEVIEAYDNGNEGIALAIMEGRVQSLGNELIDGFKALASEREAKIQERRDSIVSTGETLMYVGIAVSVLVVLLGIVAASVTSRTIAKPINTVMERMKLIANGDLRQEPLETKLKDETGQLMRATNEMNDNMRNLLQQVSTVSETVSSQSEELTQSANEVKEGSTQIAKTMQEMAHGSESQANNASDLSSLMNTFVAKVQEANANGEDIHQSSTDVLNMTSEGSQLMDASVNQMSIIDQIVKDAVEKVNGLDKQSQEISKLVSVIQDIAEQTNLLALNAAIEAARAGEHGKGFSVVADEVRKLAEQVGESVKDITGIVNTIQNESTTVTKSLQGGYEEVEKGTNQIKTTGETFTNIDHALKKMVANIEVVTNNLTTMSSSSQEMNASIEEIASVSEESAAGVEQTSASAQQASSSVEEVADSSTELAKLAEELNGLIRQFKL